MSLLAHRHRDQPPPLVPCGSDAYYWVVGTGAQRAVCGPHLVAMLNLMRLEGEDPHVPDIEPPAHATCEWINNLNERNNPS